MILESSHRPSHFCSVIRSRFEAAEAQHGAAKDAKDGHRPAEPSSLSFLDLAARLSRMDAAKLFYQTLQACHADLRALQTAGGFVNSRGGWLQLPCIRRHRGESGLMQGSSHARPPSHLLDLPEPCRPAPTGSSPPTRPSPTATSSSLAAPTCEA